MAQFDSSLLSSAAVESADASFFSDSLTELDLDSMLRSDMDFASMLLSSRAIIRSCLMAALFTNSSAYAGEDPRVCLLEAPLVEPWEDPFGVMLRSRLAMILSFRMAALLTNSSVYTAGEAESDSFSFEVVLRVISLRDRLETTLGRSLGAVLATPSAAKEEESSCAELRGLDLLLGRRLRAFSG